MIERDLYIGRWRVHFMFATDGYEDELVLTRLYDAEASYDIMRDVNSLMDSCEANCGFTYANWDSHEIIVLIGPTTSGDEFQNTLVHELHHVAVAIASSLGIDLESETPAYIAGNSMRDLAGVVCELGCRRCN